MRISPLVLLLFAMLGCGSGTEPTIPPAEKTPAENAAAAAAVKKHMMPDQLALGDPIVNSIGMLLVPVAAGQFQMGSPDSDGNAQDDEKPQHLVKITKPFYLSVYEVTQQQYEKVMGIRPWQGEFGVQDGPDNPATCLTWNDAVEFCRKLGEQEGVEYRLPTEAQWEYACRAGTTTAYSFGDDASKLGQYAWYDKNAWEIGERWAHRIGQKLPNPWGLYDMHGNCWEWCQDRYAPYGSDKTLSDPMGLLHKAKVVWCTAGRSMPHGMRGRPSATNTLPTTPSSASAYARPELSRNLLYSFPPLQNVPLLELESERRQISARA